MNMTQSSALVVSKNTDLVNSYPFTKINFFKILLATVIPGFAYLIWQWPAGQLVIKQLDIGIFNFLNKSLLHCLPCQYFWGLLNHRREVWLNLVLATLINFWIIYRAPRAQRAILFQKLVFYWIFYEIALYYTDLFFVDWLSVNRPSPSLVLAPWVKLSEVLNNRRIIDASLNCFPSGHALAMVYWICFTWALTPERKIKIFAVILGLLFILPRLFSGAHWFTDSVFSGLLAILFFTWATYTPLFSVFQFFIRTVLHFFKFNLNIMSFFKSHFKSHLKSHHETVH